MLGKQLLIEGKVADEQQAQDQRQSRNGKVK